MASRKATITMKSKAIDEFFTEKEILTCESNAISLANTMIMLINNKELREKISNDGYEKFCDLYDNTEKDFKKFILEVE